MEWLKRATSWSSIPTTEQDTSTAKEGIDKSQEDCLSCSSPCDKHPSYPEYLAKKVNTIKPLADTVKPYSKHLVICVGNAPDNNSTKWPAKVEKESNSFAQILSFELKKNADTIGHKVLITLSEDETIDRDNKLEESYDIISFPDMIRFLSVAKTQISTFVKEFLIDKKEVISPSIQHQPLEKKHYVLICAHKKRDKRCGEFGPILAAEFQKELQEKGLDDQISVSKTSHYGGHKFAGNVIVYPGGNWFGRVIPCDVGCIIDQHISQGKIINRLWRGKIDDNQSKSQATW